MLKSSVLNNNHNAGLFILVSSLLFWLMMARSSAASAQPMIPPGTQEPLQPFFVAQMTAMIEREIERFAQIERNSDDVAGAMARASINYRIVMMELLSRVDAKFTGSDPAALLGITLAQGRSDMDGLFTQVRLSAENTLKTAGNISNPGIPSLDAVRKFNDLAASGVGNISATSPAQTDALIAGIFEPLAEVAFLQLDRAPVSHWPRLTSGNLAYGDSLMTPGDSLSDRDHLAMRLDQLRRRLAASQMRNDTDNLINIIISYLIRGLEFEDLYNPIRECRYYLLQAADYTDTVRAATWMDEATTHECLDHLHRALTLYAAPETRSRGAALIDWLGYSRNRLDNLTFLYQRAINVQGLARAVLAAEDLMFDEDDVRSFDGRIDRLDNVLRAMIDYRDRKSVQVPDDLRSAMQKAVAAYESAVAALIEMIPDDEEVSDALWSAELDNRLSEHTRTFEAVRLIERAPEWREGMTAIKPRGSSAFKVRLRKMCAKIAAGIEPSQGERTLHQLESEFGRFHSMPFEQDLKAGNEVAVILTGGLHEELLELIRSTRIGWAEDWCRPRNFTGAGKRMPELCRLMTTLRDCQEVALILDNPDRLNRWAAWEMPGGVMIRTVSDIVSRLKLAVFAATEGDDVALLGQLDLIDRDAPLARLIAALSIELAGPLAELPAGAEAVLGQVIHPPKYDAWMLENRHSLAALCHAAIEAKILPTLPFPVETQLLPGTVDELAEGLLSKLDEPR